MKNSGAKITDRAADSGKISPLEDPRIRHCQRTKSRSLFSFLLHSRQLKNFLLFLFCVLTAFLMRTWHYSADVYELGKIMRDMPQSALSDPGFLPHYHKNFSPFTIESAMMFGYAQEIALGKEVPSRDMRLNGMEDIPPYGQMNMALEWFLGWSWRIKNTLFPDPPPAPEETRFQDNPRMAQWMSAELRLWASLTSGFVFLFLIAAGCPALFAFPAGLLHAVSLAAIARATGQDIVRGEFCIPLILAAMVLAHSLYRRPKLWKYLFLFPVTALAFAAWDLCQMLFGCWALYEVLRFVLGRRMTTPRLHVWIVITADVLFNAAFVPFHRVYELWRSSLVWVALPALFLAFLFARKKSKKRPVERSTAPRVRILRTAGAILILLILYGFWHMAINTPEYASNYSHFSEAMKAKILFNNVKPLLPEKLNWDARMLWTPSMHSATWEIARTFFPSFFLLDSGFRPLRFFLGELPLLPTLFLLLAAGTFLFTPVRITAKRNSEASLLPLIFSAGFLIGFIYIVRYHEFLILFLCLAIPLLCRDYALALKRPPAPAGNADLETPSPPWMKIYSMKRTASFLRFLPFALFLLVLLNETRVSLRLRRHYTGDVSMRDTAALIEWMRREPERFRGQGVAANFTVGPMFFAYAGTGIAMNPQFGLKRIRDASEEYRDILYHGSEQDLAGFCRKRNVRFVVFRRTDPDEVPLVLTNKVLSTITDPGKRERLKAAAAAKWAYLMRKTRNRTAAKAAATAAWIYSTRYIANALNVPDNAVCRKLHRASGPDSPLRRTAGRELTCFRLLSPPDDLAWINPFYAVFELLPEPGQKKGDVSP